MIKAIPKVPTQLFCNTRSHVFFRLRRGLNKRWTDIPWWRRYLEPKRHDQWAFISRVSCQKGPTRHAYAWPIGPFWQDTLDIPLYWPIPHGNTHQWDQSSPGASFHLDTIIIINSWMQQRQIYTPFVMDFQIDPLNLLASGDVVIITKVWFLNSLYRIVTWPLAAILLSSVVVILFVNLYFFVALELGIQIGNLVATQNHCFDLPLVEELI